MTMGHELRIGTLMTRVAAIIVVAVLPAANATADTIVIYGASGNLGSKIVAEALYRGHDVIGVSRNVSSLSSVDHENFSAVSGDVTSVESMLGIIRGADAVIISVTGNGPDNSPENSIVNLAALTYIAAARRLGESAPRVLQMGGGSTLRSNGVVGLGTLTAEEGTTSHGRIFGHWHALETYRATTAVQWTVVSPPPGPAFHAGERTGKFRVGENEILVGENGEASISHEDLVMAYINEIEDPQAVGKRITIGY